MIVRVKIVFKSLGLFRFIKINFLSSHSIKRDNLAITNKSLIFLFTEKIASARIAHVWNSKLIFFFNTQKELGLARRYSHLASSTEQNTCNSEPGLAKIMHLDYKGICA